MSLFRSCRGRDTHRDDPVPVRLTARIQSDHFRIDRSTKKLFIGTRVYENVRIVSICAALRYEWSAYEQGTRNKVVVIYCPCSMTERPYVYVESSDGSYRHVYYIQRMIHTYRAAKDYEESLPKRL